MKKLVFGFIIVCMALIGLQTVHAQTTGSISGTVTDPNGAVVPGATVTVTNLGTGAQRVDTTNDAGAFTISTLQPGTYSVAVEGKGFKRSVAPNIAVEVSKVAQLTVAMEVGLSGESVTVTSTQDVINTSTPTLTNVINTRQVADLPLPTRNPLDLAALQAGIAVTGNATRTASIGGLRGSATNITQDGVNALDNFVKTDSLFAISAPSLNSVSEFSITTGTVGSEAGRGVGQVNLVTRGGTNDFHGGIFYLHRNDAFNANTFFNNQVGTEREKIRQHFFGFDIGGPVYFPHFGEGVPAIWKGKDTAFFFFSYEGFRENFSQTRTRLVLTPEARTGMFRYGANSVNLLALGNQHVLNPITMAIINSTPAPNTTTCSGCDGLNIAGYQFNVVGSDPNDKYVARYDHQLVKHSPVGSHKLEFVMNRAHFFLGPDTFNGLEAPFVGGTNAFQESKRWLVTGALVSNFGNSTNVFRYGRQWSPVGFLLESNPTAPFIVFPTVGTNLPRIATTDNTFMSQGRNSKVNQVSDNFAMPSGNHFFRFGGDFQKIFADTFNDAGINQTINIGTNSSNPSGLSLAQFPGATNADVTRAEAIYSVLVGNLASSNRTFNVTTPTSGFVTGATRARLFQEHDLALYAQDQWRVWNNFTLNLGVRWEFLGVPTIPNGLAIQVTNVNDLFGISGPGNLFTPNAPAGASPATAVLDFVSGDTGKKLYNDDWNNFAPFVGIAWSPEFKKGFLHAIFGSPGRSSIRAGYSKSFLHDGFTVISNALGVGTTNPGLIQTAANNTPTGVLTAGGVPLVTPTFTIPITDRQNFLTNSGNGLWAIDPNLKIPYVNQWNVGYEREIFPNLALEIRYVGNRASKVWRGYDINEVNIFENGFLQEFKNAQINLAARGGASFAPGCVGCVALPLLSRFFGGLSNANSFGSTGFISNLNNNNVGDFASTLAFSPTYRANRENPANGIPANFFVANPNAAFARLLSNDSASNYHALEVELRKRFSGGLQFQADYTFSKALTNAPDAAGSQSDLVSFRTLRNRDLDWRRSNQDQTHRFVANGIYELPFGKRRKFFSDANGFVDQVIGNWSVGGIVTWATRPPWFVASGRSTFNSFNPSSAPAQLLGMTFEEFKKNIGVFKTPAGVFFINPDILNITYNSKGLVSRSSLKPGLIGAPPPGEWGNFPLNSLNGPRYFNFDMSITKRWPITETVRLELKTTFINVLNNTNFVYNTQNFDASTFGLITAQSGSPRIIHFTGSLRF
jgi:hypothetical protein